MSSELDELFADVLKHPELDEPRLGYANALVSSDAALASFIRESLDSDVDGYIDPPMSRDLRERLLGPFREVGATGTFGRGFVEELLVDPYVFLSNAGELLDLAPILRVSFQTADYGRRGREFPIRELMACEELKRVRCLSFWKGEYFDPASLEAIIASPNLDNLVELQTPWAHYEETNPWSSDVFHEVWPKLFACPAFRRAVRWNLGSTSLRKPGDQTIVTPGRDYYRIWEDVTYVPMPAEDRRIEEQYGYIPQLHAVNWDKTVLDALRGKFPAFPVGARPTEDMYAVPAPHRRNEDSNRENW